MAAAAAITKKSYSNFSFQPFVLSASLSKHSNTFFHKKLKNWPSIIYTQYQATLAKAVRVITDKLTVYKEMRVKVKVKIKMCLFLKV